MLGSSAKMLESSESEDDCEVSDDCEIASELSGKQRQIMSVEAIVTSTFTGAVRHEFEQ